MDIQSPRGVHPDFQKVLDELAKLSNLEVEVLISGNEPKSLLWWRGIAEAKRRGIQIKTA